MATQPTFWKRMGTMFRGSDRAGAGNGNGNGAHPSDPTVESDRGNSPLALPRRRRPSSADLQERYERVGQLLDSLREHFDVQDQRSKELGEAVARMADVLEQMPETLRAQSDCTQAIATHLSTSNRQSAELKDTLARVPSSIQAQAEAIQAVSRQMASASKTDTQMVGSLSRLSRVVNGLGIASRTQVETLQHMQSDANEQRLALANVIRDQKRAMIITASVAGAVALGAIAALLAVVLA